MIRFMLFSLTALAIPLISGAVAAQPMDFQRVSCSGTAEALEKANPTEQVAIVSWLLGYASCTTGNTSLDAKNIDQRVKDIFDYCARHPELNVLEAIENTWR
jgi:hypothetical protein